MREIAIKRNPTTGNLEEVTYICAIEAHTNPFESEYSKQVSFTMSFCQCSDEVIAFYGNGNTSVCKMKGKRKKRRNLPPLLAMCIHASCIGTIAGILTEGG